MKTFAAIAMVLGMLLACMLISPKYAQAANYDLSGNESGWVNGLGEQGSQVQFSTDGGKTWQNYTSGMTLDYGTQVRVKLSWHVPDNVKVEKGTTFTYDLPNGIAFENGTTYPMYDSTGKQRGTFTVQGNKVVATYTDSAEASSGITAYVTIDGKITRSADDKGNGGKREWDFPGIGTIETTVNPEHGLGIYKNGAVSTGEIDADGNSIYYYVLDVTSTGPNSDVTITDTMGNLLTLDPNSFELFTDAGLTTKSDKAYAATPNTDNKGFTLTIPSMSDGEKLYVKYKVKVNRQQVVDACKANAEATAQCENGNLNVTNNKATITSKESTEKTSEKGLVFKSKWTVNKNGSADADQKNINWSIELIPGDDSNTTNTAIKDVLGTDMDAPTGDVTIECYGKDNKYWPVRKTVTVKWSDLANGAVKLPEGYGRYVITYTTPIKDADSTTQTTYTNTVDGKDGDGNEFNGTGTVTIDRTEGDIAKRSLSGASVKSPIKWETTFTAKKNLDSATITDTVDQNCSGKKEDGSDNCMTTGDWQTLKRDVKVYTDAGHTKEYSDYSVEYSDGNKSFTLATGKLAKDTRLYIVYSTTVKDNAPNTVYNTATFNKSSKTATHTVTNDNMDKYVDWSSDADHGKYGWTLNVHDVAAGAKNVTVTDTLPANMEYVPGSMTVNNQSGTKLDGVSVVSHPSKDGRDTLVFTFKNPSAALTEAKRSGGKVQIGYLTRLKDVKALQGPSEFKNSAVISVDGEVQDPDQASRWINPPQLVDKTSTYDTATAPYINYTIDVNAAGSTLNDGQTLVLKDTLPDAVELQQGSVKIVDPKTQGEIQGAAAFYDPETRVLTINVPDATPAHVTYKTVVLLQPGQSLDGMAINTVTLTGYENKGGTSQSKQNGTVQAAKGGFTDSPHSLQIFKYGDGDAGGRGLGDAVFRVDQLAVDDNGSSKAWKSTGSTNVTKTLVSGTDGYTKYLGLKANEIYKVTEIQAPEGYEISSTPLYVVFPSTDAEHGHTSDYYTGATVDGQPLTVAAMNGNPQSLYLWMVNDKQDVKAKVAISKVEYGHADIAVNGALLSLVSDSDNKEIARWTTDGTQKTFDLAPGSYTLTELSAPDGYQIADVMRIVVSNNGEVTVNGSRPTTSGGAAQVRMGDKPATTAVKVAKVWNDADNQDGLRGDVTFKLWKSVDGTSSDMNLDKTLKAGRATEVSWENLPVKEGGKDVHYYVTEVSALDGYTSTCERQKTDGTWGACLSDYDGGTQYRFTNTHTPETTQVKVNKVWNDNNDSDKLRQTDVTVQLLADGKPVDGKTATLNESDNWSASFTDLPKYANGRQIAYTVKETTVPKGYSVAIASNETQDGTFSYTVTNTHTPTSGEVLISKRDVGGTEIKGAKLRLTAENGVTSDGQKFEPFEWTSDGTPKKLTLKSGTYTLTETKAPDGYLPSASITFTVEMNADGTKAIVKIDSNGTSTDADETSTVVMVDEYKTTKVKVSKTSLTEGVGEIAGAKLTVTGTTIGGEAITPISWTSGEDGLTQDGKIVPKELTLAPGTYTLHESETPEGYEPASDIVFQVTVDGTVKILSNGNIIGSTSSDGNHVTMVDSPSKTNVQFSKVEVGGSTELPGAEFRIEGTDFEGYDINPIVWTSGDAPHSVQLKDGTYTLTETKAPDGYQVSDPIRFAIKRGQAYHVSDSGEPTTPVDGNTVRVEDQHIKRLAISVTKRWSDNLDADKYRTTSVTVQLQQNGHPFGDRITLDSSNHWTTTWSELLATDDNGKTYSYTVNEIQDTDFAKKYHFTLQKRPLTDGYEFTMINIHKPDTIDLEATKQWNDADNQDGVRPDQVCVVVYGTSDQPKDDDPSQYEPVKETMLKENCEQLTAKKNWTMSASGLPKNNIYGKPYTYTVEETRLGYASTDADGKTTYTYKNVMDGTDPTKANADTKYEKPGYSYTTVKTDNTTSEATKTGCESTGIATCKATITNTHTPETVTLSVTKHWDDAENQLGQRPKTLTFWVLSSIWKNNDSAQKTYLPGWLTPQTATGECSKNVADYGLSTTTGLAGATGLAASGTAWGKSCIVLSKDGVAETSDGSLDANDTSKEWPSYTFQNLPKYYKGQKIHYDVTESMPSGLADRSDDYEATVKETTQNENALAFDVTNRYRYVVLPETGGDGNDGKPAAILIAISSICLIGACVVKTHENRKRHALGRSMR